jgi:glycosyltransferase involved in cell wall biosynthesis
MQSVTMRILHIIPSISSLRGGPSQAVLEMVKALQKCGVNAEILTTNDDGYSLLDVPLCERVIYGDVPVWFFPRFSPNYYPIREFAFSWEFTQWLWRNIQYYELLHVHAIFSYCSTVAMAIARLRNIPYIVRPLGQLCQWSLQQSAAKKSLYLNVIERKNINQSASLHLTSNAEKQEIEQLNLECKNFVIPHGLALPGIIPNASQLLREYFQLSSKEPIILFLSRIHPKKGLEYLIQALAQIKDKKFTLIIAGNGDSDYEAQINSCLHDYGLEDCSLMTGFVEGELKQLLLQGANLFVLTSYSENFGVAVLEALAAGTPALVTPGVALAQEIEQNDLGYVVPQEPTAIAKAIEKHLELPESEEDKLSQKARQFVLDNYSWDKIAQQLLTVYSVLGITK